MKSQNKITTGATIDDFHLHHPFLAHEVFMAGFLQNVSMWNCKSAETWILKIV